MTWIIVLALSLARMFPQPTEELIRRSCPAKFKKLYGSRLMGIIDCTEGKTQTPSDKQAQRALWSDYKSNNTVKYLVVMSPCGSIIYVSPAFPGRISDPQICHACATFSEADFAQLDDVLELSAVDALGALEDPFQD